jgi:hypothetical protein
LQRVRGIISATLVGVPLSAFLWFWLHAPLEVSILISVVLGAVIFTIVASRSDWHEAAEDAAWRDAAPDLPPVSDRRILELDQLHMPGPEKSQRGGGRARRQAGVLPGGAASSGVDTK